MKKLTAVLAFAALTALSATAAFAGAAPATGVVGSMHDITYMGAAHGFYNQDQFQRVCIFCHTPHNAMTVGQTGGGVPAPLWNHAVTSLVSPLPYQWAAPANLPINIIDPLMGPTRLCLGCHDGQTAVDSHGTIGGATAGTANNGNHVMSGSKVVNDFTVTHPVGFLYADALAVRNTDPAKPELALASDYFIDRVYAQGAVLTSINFNTNVGSRASSPGFVLSNKKIGDTLYSGFMTCATCHEVHNYRNALNDQSVDPTGNPAGFTPNYFVWAREQGSALCLSCHYK
jgi:hypothetical protein